LNTPIKKSERAETRWQRFQLTKIDWCIALLFIFATLLARWPYIQAAQTVLHTDEAIVGTMANDILQGERFPLYFYGQRYMGALEAYAIAAVQAVIGSPMISLRLAPALFLTALVAATYLMLTHWFGRRGAIVGAASLIACSPMFLQWSVAARGGYVEVMLCGILLWWGYGHWCTGTNDVKSWHRAAMGSLIGFGLWINPMMAVFMAPIVVHALLNRPLRYFEASNLGSAWVRFSRDLWPNVPWTMPAVVLGLVTALSFIVCVTVGSEGVEYVLLYNIIPKPAAAGVIMLICVSAGAWVAIKTTWFKWARTQVDFVGPFIFGFIAGQTPAIAYVVIQKMRGEPLEDCLPLALRPIYALPETLGYLITGLPLVLGSDPHPVVNLSIVGYVLDMPSVSQWSYLVVGTNFLCLITLAILALAYWRQNRESLLAMLRLQPGLYGPAAFLPLAGLGLVGMYAISGCAINLTSIRYLVPLFCSIAGMFAVLAASQRAIVWNRVLLGIVLACWTGGQITHIYRLGAPHPLSPIADELDRRKVQFAHSEPLDAHLLSFLTGPNTRLIEYSSFWPRLAHHREMAPADGPQQYVVQTVEFDWRKTWTWDDDAPVQTYRILYPRLKEWVKEHPDDLISREPLINGYELWTLRREIPLPTQDAT
jgi:hypothetical protein